MQKNLYYRTVFRRRNAVKEAFYAFFLAFCSRPRLLLEVFLRRNLGQRYFSFSTAITLVVVLSILPMMMFSIQDMVLRGGGFYRRTGLSSFVVFLLSYGTWYAFLAAFLYFAIQRRDEITRLPSVFDFARFSLSTGDIHPAFYKVKIEGKPADVRTIETLLEPGVAFGAGFVLFFILGQFVGGLLMLCGLCYSISYQAAYHNGDNFVMDRIDEMILNEEQVKAFVEGRTPDETRGVNFRCRRPADPDLRRQVVETFTEEDEPVEAY
jgi:hypothetical protein